MTKTINKLLQSHNTDDFLLALELAKRQLNRSDYYNWKVKSYNNLIDRANKEKFQVDSERLLRTIWPESSK